MKNNWDHTFKVKRYWFGVPRGPPLAFKVPKSLKIDKMKLKMGSVRLYFVITIKI
jgi:hypothetical protein